MECPECGEIIEQSDTTYSNVNTDRAREGQHTGNIYWCEKCETYWLENLLDNGSIERYSY